MKEQDPFTRLMFHQTASSDSQSMDDWLFKKRKPEAIDENDRDFEKSHQKDKYQGTGGQYNQIEEMLEKIDTEQLMVTFNMLMESVSTIKPLINKIWKAKKKE
ncbi:hypothetical protein J9303_04880 [Bacillaceae bacterium Marseille-Q3522]|nr:hypothetical protein [Bacillaceae bacterium Marseille-Q3522]